ncbi:hypothetical protein Prudu_002486 [Prunus dulcis]|uniref:Uncharacterized protein n=1 Tax=Prunus dulcis TaxID=3755 RepID=A0A4Y1QQY6_PRUDU|nr:hypothetical protein Prudu_002486 [Prunus dulcis]
MDLVFWSAKELALVCTIGHKHFRWFSTNRSKIALSCFWLNYGKLKVQEAVREGVVRHEILSKRCAG